MGENHPHTEAAAALDAVIVQEILRAYHRGERPLVSRRRAQQGLEAIGLPLPAGIVRDLMVTTTILGGESVGTFDDYVQEARAYVKRRLARPNLKRAAAAKARAARRGATAEPVAEPGATGSEAA